jgi:tripartite-type tricarboxylate transporter receptor subunit TctC
LKLLSTLTTALVLAAALPAGAQTFPDKTITIIVGASPGGSTDVSARLLADPLQ